MQTLFILDLFIVSLTLVLVTAVGTIIVELIGKPQYKVNLWFGSSLILLINLITVYLEVFSNKHTGLQTTLLITIGTYFLNKEDRKEIKDLIVTLFKKNVKKLIETEVKKIFKDTDDE